MISQMLFNFRQIEKKMVDLKESGTHINLRRE
jgi:hypothetical protein